MSNFGKLVEPDIHPRRLLVQGASTVYARISLNWGGTILGVPTIRIMVYWVLYWGTSTWGN